MKILNLKNSATVALLLCILFSFSSCLTAKKLDKYVAAQYNNELPKPIKRKKPEIEVTPANTGGQTTISTSVHQTDKFLPLIVYWKYDHRQTCTLNPAIPIVNFENAMYSLPTKNLIGKLNGRKVELTVQKAPAAFSIVMKENAIWVIYVFDWAKVYIEPDTSDLVVSYKLLDGNKQVKTGTITVKNTEKNKGIRFFQSWKSATSEHLDEYNTNFTSMTKSSINQLTEEL